MKHIIIIFIFLSQVVYTQEIPISTLESNTHLTDIVPRANTHFHPNTLSTDSPHHLHQATCGTMAIMGLRSNRNQLSPATKKNYSFLFQQNPPTRTESVTSPSGRFKVHYNTTGLHAVALTDSNANGIPDYVDETIKAFDESWTRQINELGYKPPPSDGDGIYDIYISSLGTRSLYGLTWPLGSDTTVPSYIEIDNNFTDANVYYTQGIDGLRVTAAHEFFHAIQFGYYANFDAIWWLEMTATWMEDVVYPDINDFYAYVPSRFNDPEISLDYFPGGTAYPFGGAVFAHHIEQVYGTSAIRNTWENLLSRAPQNYQLNDINIGMPSGSLDKVFPRYAIWNYLTGARARPNYYSEAPDLPAVKIRDLGASGNGTGSITVDHLGATYIRVETAALSGGLRANFTLPNHNAFTFVVLLIQPSRVSLLWPKSTTITIPNANRFSEVVFIPAVTSLNDDDLRVDYTISSGAGNSVASDLVADFNKDGNVNFTDFVTFTQGFGAAPTETSHNPQLDLNGDGPIDFQDFLIFVSYFGESI